MSIRTPLDINYQIQAINSLRKGIEAYDKRQGWRGPITNKKNNPNWKKKLKQFKNRSYVKNWKFAEIISLEPNHINFKILEGSQGKIFKNKLNWVLSNKKKISDKFKIGDIIFVKKQNNVWNLKQYPKVNGGIVVIDPYSGDVKALVGGFNFKSSEFNRVTQAKDNLGQLLNLLCMLQL